jgi:charged multivesicular body protein 4
MSGIWGWFGGGAAQKRKDNPKNVIITLRTQLEMLEKRQKHLENQIEQQNQIAKKNVTTNKQGKNRLSASPCAALESGC